VAVTRARNSVESESEAACRGASGSDSSRREPGSDMASQLELELEDQFDSKPNPSSLSRLRLGVQT
jgi:hypothetical protein